MNELTRAGPATLPRWRAWVLACRPATLAAALVPVAVGTACARALGGLRVGPALAALAGALLLQIGANLANDVFDYEKGADTHERLGPTRAVQSGLLPASSVRTAMFVVFGLALVVGAYLTAVAGPAIIAIGLLSIACAVAYTGGPWPLGYHGLGDLFVMLFFGFVAVCGTAFVQLGRVPALAWWAAVPVGSLSTAILIVNNIRDCTTDLAAGKRTLAVRFGRRAAFAEYLLLLAAAYCVPVLLFAIGAASPWVLLPLLSLPIAVSLAWRLAKQEGAPLNQVLVGTARLMLVMGLAFALGLVPGA